MEELISIVLKFATEGYVLVVIIREAIYNRTYHLRPACAWIIFPFDFEVVKIWFMWIWYAVLGLIHRKNMTQKKPWHIAYSIINYNMCFKMHTIKASIISHHWRLTCTIIQSFKSNLSLYPLKVQVLADQSPNNEYQFKETITEFVCQNALPNQSTYELTNLNPNTYYEVRIRANNVHGLSESSLYIFKTKGGKW